MRYPDITTVAAMIKFANENSAHIPGVGYVPARPIGLQTLPNRVRAAWLVFTGRADALLWPGGQ